MAYIKHTQFSKMGDLEFVIQIPAEYKDRAIDLTDAITIPLELRIRLWGEFKDELDAAE